MKVVRRTVSLPPAVAERLDREATQRGKSFSALVTELLDRQPPTLPYAGLIEDDPDLSLKVDAILGRLSG